MCFYKKVNLIICFAFIPLFFFFLLEFHSKCLYYLIQFSQVCDLYFPVSICSTRCLMESVDPSLTILMEWCTGWSGWTHGTSKCSIHVKWNRTSNIKYEHLWCSELPLFIWIYQFYGGITVVWETCCFRYKWFLIILIFWGFNTYLMLLCVENYFFLTDLRVNWPCIFAFTHCSCWQLTKVPPLHTSFLNRRIKSVDNIY